LEKTLIASYLIELVDQFTRGGKENGNLFRLLQDFLILIDAGEISEWLVRFFEIRLLKLSGYEPVLDRCLACKKPVSDAYTYRFHVKEGGLRCNACHPGGFGSLPVSFGAIGTLLLGKELKSLRVLTEVRNMGI